MVSPSLRSTRARLVRHPAREAGDVGDIGDSSALDTAARSSVTATRMTSSR
jgi:hypothetical protein